ncbi:MAG TPA: hypothetical protein PK640_13535 [Verrucomicrobiota bacterium]|nr:hypothetical protein [Verrucomicrobiota bacterium]
MKPYPLKLEIAGPTAMWTRPDNPLLGRGIVCLHRPRREAALE